MIKNIYNIKTFTEIKPWYFVFLFLFLINIHLYSQNSTEDKMMLNLPDVVIKGQDRSETDILQKEEVEVPQVEYHKEIPTSKKINTDVLLLEPEPQKSSFLYGENKKEQISQFSFSVGSLEILSYEFIYGKISNKHRYFLTLLRSFTNDYIPYTSSSYDKITLDYAYKYSDKEKLSASTGLYRQSHEVPSPNDKLRGDTTTTIIPVTIFYQKKMSAQEDLRANLELRSIDVNNTDKYKNLFCYGSHIIYENNMEQDISLLTDVKLNNNVNKLGIKIKYQPIEIDRIKGFVDISFYHSLLPNIDNESYFVGNFSVNYLVDNVALELSYLPRMLEINYNNLYLNNHAVEMNDQLLPQLDLSLWELKASQKVDDKLTWQTTLTTKRSKQVIGYADIDNDGFLKPINYGWAYSVIFDSKIMYNLFQYLSTELGYKYSNIKLENGHNLPGKPLNELYLTAKYKEPEGNYEGIFQLQYIGEQTDIIDQDIDLDSFFVANIALLKDIDSWLKFKIEVNNIFNERYYLRSDFYEPGFNLKLGGEVIL